MTVADRGGLRLLPQVETGSKRCSVCQQHKPFDINNKHASAFHLDRRTLRDGTLRVYPKGECKDCARQRVARWREQERAAGRMKERQRRYNQNRDQQLHAALRRERRAFEREQRTGRGADGARQRPDLSQTRRDNQPFLQWLTEYQAATGMSQQSIARMMNARFGSKDAARRLREVARGQARVTIEFVDRVAVALDQPQLVTLLYPMDDEVQ